MGEAGGGYGRTLDLGHYLLVGLLRRKGEQTSLVFC